MKTGTGVPFVLVLVAVLIGCGGSNPVVVSVSPLAMNVIQGGTQTFTATVTGARNTAVSWTVQEGAGGGSITSTGVYTAPNKAGRFHVVATSQADTTKSANATAIVPGVAISLNQTAVTIDVGNHFTFVPNVTGATNTAISWSVQEGASGGSITGSGVYTAPGTDGVFHVIATSQADPTQKAAATVTVATLVVSVTPPSDALGPLGGRAFSATVNTSLDASVTWSVQEGAPGGVIAANGQYTAPNTTGLFHVVATSVQDPTKSAIANVSIVPSGFRPTGVMTTSRTTHTATLLQTGKVLLAGGDSCYLFGYYGPCPLSSAEVYDPGTGTFTITGSMSVKRSFHTATLLNNGKVLITGGPGASAELYDPSSGVFTPTGAMSVGRSAHTATLLPSGKVLIAGGESLSGPLASAELYDPNNGSFTGTGTMLEARTTLTATMLANGKVLIAGGSNSTGELSTAELYDPATGSFTATNSMVSKRAFHAATLLSTGNVLITGGSNQAPLSSAEVYDVVAGSFTATGAMMTARDSHIAILLANGTVLLAGDSSDFTAELYSTGSGTFTQTGSMDIVRQLPAAVLLQDGQVLMSGGSDAKSAELYK